MSRVMAWSEAALLGLAVLAGCETHVALSGASAASQKPQTFSGQWSGRYALPKASETVTMSLLQSGEEISGGYIVGEGRLIGNLNGTLNGSRVQFTLTQLVPCDRLLFGTAEVESDSSLAATVRGLDCQGFDMRAAFKIARR